MSVSCQSADQLLGYLSSPQSVLPAVLYAAFCSWAVMRLFAPTASPAPPVGSAIILFPMGGLLLYILYSSLLLMINNGCLIVLSREINVAGPERQDKCYIHTCILIL